MLIVVRPNDTDLYEYLVRRFAGVRGIRVILERRRTQETVRNERRIRQGTVSTLGYAVVRFKPKPASSARVQLITSPVRQRGAARGRPAQALCWSAIITTRLR